jgi:hypothetical protein
MAKSVFKLLMKGAERRERIKTQLGARKSRAAVRAHRTSKMRTSRSRALPKLMNVKLANNYTNPVTLNALMKGKAYQVRNHGTGRKNYYNRVTLFSLLPSRIKNNYNLLMAFPKKALFRNPMTRGNVYPRNIVPVRII